MWALWSLRSSLLLVVVGGGPVSRVSSDCDPGSITIELERSVFESSNEVLPEITGCADTIIYVSTQPFFESVIAQRMTEKRWWPELSFECSDLFPLGGKRVPPNERFIIPHDWKLAISRIAPAAYFIAPGTYRWTLVFAITDPATTRQEDLQCFVAHSKEFTLEREGFRTLIPHK
jgi:hypothetical protein